MNKKILWLDMDGVIVDFMTNVDTIFKQTPHYRYVFGNNIDLIPNVFKDSIPIEGALSAIDLLEKSGKYEIMIATTAPWYHTTADSDKKEWVKKYLPDSFKKKMTITHRKDLLMGDYLVDDRTANGAGEFKGELIPFGSDKFPDWKAVLNYLL